MTPLHLPCPLLADLLAHARAEAPNECCGLLAGTANLVTLRLPLVNALASPTRFESSPVSMFAAMREMKRLDLDILAVYHSHPTTHAAPSATDREFNYADGVATVIVSLASEPPIVRAWRLEAGRFVEVELKMSEPLS